MIIDFKEDIGSNTTVVGVFNTTLSPLDRSKTKIQQGNSGLERKKWERASRCVQGFSSPKDKYTFVSSAHGAFSERTHAGPQTYFHKVKEEEMASIIFSLEIEVNHAQKQRIKSNTWKLKFNIEQSLVQREK